MIGSVEFSFVIENILRSRLTISSQCNLSLPNGLVKTKKVL